MKFHKYSFASLVSLLLIYLYVAFIETKTYFLYVWVDAQMYYIFTTIEM